MTESRLADSCERPKSRQGSAEWQRPNRLDADTFPSRQFLSQEIQGQALSDRTGARRQNSLRFLSRRISDLPGEQ